MLVIKGYMELHKCKSAYSVISCLNANACMLVLLRWGLDDPLSQSRFAAGLDQKLGLFSYGSGFIWSLIVGVH